MSQFGNFLRNGYFPLNVPQCFNSRSYAKALATIKAPAGFAATADPKAAWCAMAEHNLARVGTLRRVLGIPNPVPFYTLAKEITDNWKVLDPILTRSRLTLTRPVPTTVGPRAFRPTAGFPDRPRLRARYRVGSRYMLKTDVLRFYPSVYTHSIGWAVDTKAKAKAKMKSLSLLGNRLDICVRTAQSGQTTGLPIGPDSSWVLSEIILAAVDEALSKQLRGVTGNRAVDDYELYFKTAAQAEDALTALQGCLAYYGLDLNSAKTGISSLPAALDDNWTKDLRAFVLRQSKVAQINDLITYFSLAFTTAAANPTDSVLRYAIRRIESETLLKTSWQTYQDLLLQCALGEPGTLQYVLAATRKQQLAGRKIDNDRFEETITQLIVRHQPLSHGSEVAWAAWASISLGIKLSKNAVKRLSKSEDPLVPLIALNAENVGLAAGLDKSRWAALMTADELRGRHWLLAYEAYIRKWLPSVTGADYVSADPAFGFLKSNRVHFYTAKSSATSVPTWPRVLTLSKFLGYDL